VTDCSLIIHGVSPKEETLRGLFKSALPLLCQRTVEDMWELEGVVELFVLEGIPKTSPPAHPTAGAVLLKRRGEQSPKA